jgi:hypothetical protein
MAKKGVCLILLVFLLASLVGLRNVASFSEPPIDNSGLSSIPIEETKSFKNGMRPAEEYSHEALSVEDLLYLFEEEIDPLDITIIEAINLQVPHYYQNEQSWSNHIMQTCGLTIGSAGCALTSFTMVANYLGSNDNPGQANTKLGDYACDFHWYAPESIYGFTYGPEFNANPIPESGGKAWILGELRKGNPVIVGYRKPTGGLHYVVCWAYTCIMSQGHLYEYYAIHDPTYGSNEQYSLDGYLDQGYYLRNLRVYRK